MTTVKAARSAIEQNPPCGERLPCDQSRGCRNSDGLRAGIGEGGARGGGSAPLFSECVQKQTDRAGTEDPGGIAVTEREACFQFKPDAEHINALPKPLHQYIHQLETRADPSGDIQTIASQAEQVRGLTALLNEYRETLRDIVLSLRGLRGISQ